MEYTSNWTVDWTDLFGNGVRQPCIIIMIILLCYIYTQQEKKTLLLSIALIMKLFISEPFWWNPATTHKLKQ